MLRAATTRAALALAAGVLAALGGCEWLDRVKTTRDGATTGGGPVAPVTADKLVNYLNTQAAYLQSVRYPDVSIDVKAGRESHSLNSSTLICAKPRNFLLVGGKLVMSDLVNIGSNDQEFWMYSRFPERTYIYCSHADFPQAGRQLPVPFDPDWALQALGMTTYPPNLAYQVETDQKAREHRLSFETATPQGTPVRREIVFEADDALSRGPRAPQVKRHTILAAGAGKAAKPIAVAEVKEAATVSVRDPQTGQPANVQVPTAVSLAWPQQEFRMDLRLNKPTVNERLSDDETRRMFTKPQIDGANPINLADARFSPSSFRGATPGDLPPRRRP